ncbi:MAG: ATP-binding cassette domain-containing protein [Bacteroidetes bacterium]|jgi:zinc transport system ATP-binding protein|nr:ATP-binding cassette domain-containing protein [Bacteroidota bacterium]
MTAPDAADADAIAVDALTVRYRDHAAVQDVSFRAASASFIAIVGPNGSGKTTLLKALLGLETPDAGTVRVLGRPPDAVPAGQIGYVPQIKTFERSFPAVAVELVLSALHQRWPFRVKEDERTQAVQALDHVGAHHLADRALGELSGGELQRVYLARSIIRQPRLLLLDEPATGVDRAGAHDLYDLLDAYQARTGATVLMVTHDWNAAYHHASHVLVLDRTQISYGPPDAALSEANLRQAFGHVGHAHAMLIGRNPDD